MLKTLLWNHHLVHWWIETLGSLDMTVMSCPKVHPANMDHQKFCDWATMDSYHTPCNKGDNKIHQIKHAKMLIQTTSVVFSYLFFSKPWRSDAPKFWGDSRRLRRDPWIWSRTWKGWWNRPKARPDCKIPRKTMWMDLREFGVPNISLGGKYIIPNSKLLPQYHCFFCTDCTAGIDWILDTHWRNGLLKCSKHLSANCLQCSLPVTTRLLR